LWQVRDDRGSAVPESLRGALDRAFGLGPEIDVTWAAIRSRFTLRYCHDVAVKTRPFGQILLFGVTVFGTPLTRGRLVPAATADSGDEGCCDTAFLESTPERSGSGGSLSGSPTYRPLSERATRNCFRKRNPSQKRFYRELFKKAHRRGYEHRNVSSPVVHCSGHANVSLELPTRPANRQY
jgi:hypothetical protein